MDFDIGATADYVEDIVVILCNPDGGVVGHAYAVDGLDETVA